MTLAGYNVVGEPLEKLYHTAPLTCSGKCRLEHLTGVSGNGKGASFGPPTSRPMFSVEVS